MTEPTMLPGATAMAAAIRAGQATALDLLEQHLARVDRFNPALNAIIWQDREGARARARALDEDAARGVFHGPLHGVPITIKDAFDLAGAPSTWGNPAWRDNIPDRHSEVAARYLDAGAVIFGKTNVPLLLADWQTFNAIHGTTNNPWDVSRAPGGSSGGSAAALASGMSALEAGSDIGSSIRNPSHYCGTFGLKPTWNVVPMQGHLPPGWHTDVDIGVGGPMARSARDLSLAFDVLAHADAYLHPAWAVACPPDARTSLKDFRIALKLGDPVCAVDRAYQDQLSALADRLSAAGATVRQAEPEIDTAAHFENYMTLLGAALSFGVSEEEIAAERAVIEAGVTGPGRALIDLRLGGRAMRHADWAIADNKRRMARKRFDAFFEDWDILLAPVCASAAFHHNQEGHRYQRMLTINGAPQAEPQQMFWAGYSGVVGLPSVVGPAGAVGGLPVGYQAIAGHGRDHTALAFARAVEREIIGFTPPPGYE